MWTDRITSRARKQLEEQAAFIKEMPTTGYYRCALHEDKGLSVGIPCSIIKERLMEEYNNLAVAYNMNKKVYDKPLTLRDKVRIFFEGMREEHAEQRMLNKMVKGVFR